MMRRRADRARRQWRRCFRDNRASESLDHEMVDAEWELYAEFGYDVITGMFRVPRIDYRDSADESGS